MSEDCNFGIDRTPLYDELVVGGIHCPEKCRSLKHLVPDDYEGNNPLVKIPGTSPVQYRKWKPGDAGIDAIRLCHVDGSTWKEPCEVYICIAASQVNSALLCWPEGTTEADIQLARDAEGCCITLQGVPCIPHDKLPCWTDPKTGETAGEVEERKKQMIDDAVQTASEAEIEQRNIAQVS